MFEWDKHNLAKLRAHAIRREEVEQVFLNDPIPIYQQTVQSEVRYVYYGESRSGRLLALVFTERGTGVRVVTAYDLDASQKRDYLMMRVEELNNES